MTLIERILKNLLETSLYYKGMRVNALGFPTPKNCSRNCFRTTLYRMKKKGLIKKDNTGWFITRVGKKYIKKKADSLLNFTFKSPENSPKNLIVMFDIPETKKAEREWFRWHLKKFGYIMVQKSIWVGPSPLPKEFMNYLKNIKLDNTLKIFKLAKPYKSDSGHL